MQYPTRQHWTIYALLFALLVLITPHTGFYIDLDFWQRWAIYIFRHGLANTYQYEDVDVPPIYPSLLAGFGWVLGSVEKIAFYRSYIKVLLLPFDFAAVILVVRTFGRGNSQDRFVASLLVLGNVAYVYNTVVWVQHDAVFTCFVVAAVVLALGQHPTASLVAYVLALNAKLQAIVFLPPLALLWLPLWWRAPRTLLTGFAAAATVQILVLAPFVWGGEQNSLPRIVHVVTHSADRYPHLSMNAYNWWVLSFKDFYVSDALRYGPLTYKQWGLLAFCAASAVLLLPVAVATWHKLRRGTVFDPADYAPLLLSLGLLPVGFAFFNTQMHERYWHPGLIFLAAYGLLTGRYFLYGLFSLAYFLNLEAVVQALHLRKYSTALFDPRLVAGLFGLILVLGVARLYQAAWRTPNWQWGQSRPPVVAGALP